jgi:hypothetical protein
MCPDALPPVDLDAFRQTAETAVAGARSLDEIEAWLASQQRVTSVRLADYLLKSDPPQRDFIVEFTSGDGSTVTKVVNIVDLGNQRFQFRTLRDR